MKTLKVSLLLLCLAAVSFCQPTVSQIFGANPYQTNVTITIPGLPPAALAPEYFATPKTASIVAQMVNGSVVEQSVEPAAVSGSVFVSAPYQMVRVNGVLLNAGLVANFFSHGYQADFISAMIRNEVVNQAALSGLTLNPSSVTVNIPSAAPPTQAVPAGLGSFGSPIPLGDASGAAFNMVTNDSPVSASFNGETNAQAGIASPNGKTYVGSVLCYNGLFGFKCTGRWALAQ